MPTSVWDQWIPGVLCRQQLVKLVNAGHVQGVRQDSYTESSLDLHVTDCAFELPSGSVKPQGGRYLHTLQQDRLATEHKHQTNGVFLLEKKHTYLFKTLESLRDLKQSPIHGQATARSTIGRVDVLARLIVDGMDTYESFDPRKIESGDMYLEITPMTFNVAVESGTSISQLRFFVDRPEQSEVRSEVLFETVLHRAERSAPATCDLTVDLSPAVVGGIRACAFCAIADGDELEPIDLSKIEYYDPCKYWKILEADHNDRLRIRKGEFYILRSKETITVPKGIAIYCRATDETIGEMRIHYAGFAHPMFGLNRSDRKVGTPLIFEVRGHDVDVCLNDGEILAKLIFYRMSEDFTPSTDKETVDGSKCDLQATPTPYTDQSLTLSAIFKKWPEKLAREQNGRVAPA